MKVNASAKKTTDLFNFAVQLKIVQFLLNSCFKNILSNIIITLVLTLTMTLTLIINFSIYSASNNAKYIIE